MEIPDIWTSPYTAAVAVLGAVLWSLPDLADSARLASWRKALGWALVVGAGAVGLALGAPLADTLRDAALGLAGSWLLIELAEGARWAARRIRGREAALALVAAGVAAVALQACAAPRQATPEVWRPAIQAAPGSAMVSLHADELAAEQHRSECLRLEDRALYVGAGGVGAGVLTAGLEAIAMTVEEDLPWRAGALASAVVGATLAWLSTAWSAQHARLCGPPPGSES